MGPGLGRSCWSAPGTAAGEFPDGEETDVEVRDLSEEHCSVVALGGRDALMLNDASALGRPTGHLNWMSDYKLAAGLLGRLRKFDKEAARAFDVTEALYKGYLEAYPGFTFQNDRQHDQEAARFRRVEELVRVVERDRSLLEAAAEALLSHPAVQGQLVEQKRLALDAARLEAQAIVEAEFAERRAEVEREREELGRVERQREDLLGQLSALEAAVEERRARADREIAEVEAELVDRLRAIADRPAEAFAQAAVLRALLGDGRGRARSPPTPRPSVLRCQ